MYHVCTSHVFDLKKRCLIPGVHSLVFLAQGPGTHIPEGKSHEKSVHSRSVLKLLVCVWGWGHSYKLQRMVKSILCKLL